MDFTGKSVLITGASRGLGKALALLLATQGARVALVGRNLETLKQVEQEIRSQGGIAFSIQADVADKRAIYPIAAQAAELAGPIDILINNASTLGPVPLRLLNDTECEEFGEVLEANLLAPFRLTKAVTGSMLLRGGGVVVNISSDAAVSAYPTWGAYSVSKAGLDHLTRIWAAELAETGIVLFSFDPGEMDTHMHAEAMPEADRTQLAKPEAVAVQLVSLLTGIRQISSGSRSVAGEAI
ncbi:MAG: SDR family oxidoreductase [Blastocatellia bacterium]|nr:SDR family oxidoreductase [Blastocatellia bacterium]